MIQNKYKGLVKKSVFYEAPFLSFGHPSPSGGRKIAMASGLAPYGGKLAVRPERGLFEAKFNLFHQA